MIGLLATRMRTIGSKLASSGALATGGYDLNQIAEEVKSGLAGSSLGQVGSAGLEMTLAGLRAQGPSTQADILELLMGSNRVNPGAANYQFRRIATKDLERYDFANSPAGRVASAMEYGQLVGSTHSRLNLDAFQRVQTMRLTGDDAGAASLLSQFTTPASALAPAMGGSDRIDRLRELYSGSSASLLSPIRSAIKQSIESLGPDSTRVGMLRELAAKEEQNLDRFVAIAGAANMTGFIPGYVQSRLSAMGSDDFAKTFTRDEYNASKARVKAFGETIADEYRDVRRDPQGNLHRYDRVVGQFQTFRQTMAEARADGFVSPGEMQALESIATGGPGRKSASDVMMEAAKIFLQAATAMKSTSNDSSPRSPQNVANGWSGAGGTFGQ
jgi:hypothetical protein